MSACVPSIGSSFLSDVYEVTCTCGFTVADLSSYEAAEDTVRWHLNEPSSQSGSAF
jgi:hypothetical protein